MTLRVLINAGPWLPVPPPSYGGIENVLATLIPELRRRGVHVVLATIGASTLPVDERLVSYNQPQFRHLQQPYNRAMGIAHGHLQEVVRELRRRTDIDVVHDHVEVVGAAVLAAMGAAVPPVLHTLHWDLGKHPQFYGNFNGGGTLLVNGVSAAQLAAAPEALRAHSLGHAHLATPLAQGADRRTAPVKRDHFVTLGRITPGKGQHIIARLAQQLKVPLVLAGPIGPYHDADELAAGLEADSSAASNPDVRYWQREVTEHVDGDFVRWVGTVGGPIRDELVSSARASVFPLQWDEPGGTAVVESLALGTPVIGLRRGCLPELVDHGQTGLLADTVDELAVALRRAAELDPQACRIEAAQRFTPAVMAEKYLQFYGRLIDHNPLSFGSASATCRMLLVSGSLRSSSTNTAVLRTAQASTPEGVETVLYTGLAGLPHFNPDDETDALPSAVADLRSLVHAADAMVFSTPEYAGAMPGSFKNLLDWAIGDDQPGSIYEKPVAWINASPRGAVNAHDSLRKVLGYASATIVEAACADIPVTGAMLGDDGLIADPSARNHIVGVLATLAAHVRCQELRTPVE